MTDNQASSIGLVGEPYYNSDNDRTKSLSTDVYRDSFKLKAHLCELVDAQKKHNSSRLTGIAIATKDALDTAEELRVHTEAIIPLENGINIAYFGLNKPEREDSLQVREALDALLVQSRFTKRTTLDQAMARTTQQGYTLEVLENPTLADIDDVLGIYSKVYSQYTFSLDQDNVAKMLQNENSIICVARSPKGRIVSIGIVENAPLELKDGEKTIQFGFAELSDAATHPDHQRQGLYAGVAHLAHYAALSRGDIDVITGQIRACHLGVNIAWRQIGRRYCGTLPNHCKLGGHRDVETNNEYETLHLVALTKQQLRESYPDVEHAYKRHSA